jgi:lipoprotein-releasing system ATP-binding protein
MTDGLSTNGAAKPLVALDRRVDLEVVTLVKDYQLHWRAVDEAHNPPEKLTVLKGISFTVKAGERVAIVGKSGAGKSTLLHLLGALDAPTSGEIKFGGANIARWGGWQLARFRNLNLGFIFQFHHLLPEFTALENVMMPAIIGRQSRATAMEKAKAVLKEVGLEYRMEHRPGELSGGERQRVAVARAIVLQPAIVLADEPTGNLDAKTGGAIHDLLVKLSEERGMSLVTVTHNPDLARRMHRQIRLIEGHATEEAPGTAMEIPAEATS